MKLHDKLPPKYGELISKLRGHKIFNLMIVDSMVLEGLVITAWIIAKKHNPTEAVRRIENLVLANLASIWTFKLLDDSRFPYYSHTEVERWYLGHLSVDVSAEQNTDWQGLVQVSKNRYQFESVNSLQTQLGARIGKCSTYTITLGIILCACELVDDLELISSKGQAWVYCQVKGEDEYRNIDLSLRSHGELEADKGHDYYKKLMTDECAVKYDLLDLD